MIATVAALLPSAVCAAVGLVVVAFTVEALTHGLIRLRYARHAHLLEEVLHAVSAAPRSPAFAPPCYGARIPSRPQEVVSMPYGTDYDRLSA